MKECRISSAPAMELPQSCDKPAINSLVINYGISDITQSEFNVFEVNYGISNTTVLEIPQFTTKTARYPITQLYATAMFDREKKRKKNQCTWRQWNFQIFQNN